MKCFHLREETKTYFWMNQLQPNMFNFSNVYIPHSNNGSIPYQINHYPAQDPIFRIRENKTSNFTLRSSYKNLTLESNIQLEATNHGLLWKELNK